MPVWKSETLRVPLRGSRECFARYVQTKVTKRLEANKLRAPFKEAPKSLLLPVSLGSSSVVLLYVLDQILHYEESRTSRCSFQLHVLFIDQKATQKPTSYEESWSVLMERFPSHRYSWVRLDEIFDYDDLSGFEADPHTITGMSYQDVDRNHALETLLANMSSQASRSDMIGILRSRLVTAFAKTDECECILYGDSTTKIAERVLTETAKGRGGALPWLTEDGQSPHDLKVVYPMRDLLRKEIAAYARMIKPSLESIILESRTSSVGPISAKENTIEDLMGQYFESVEENYPSIVANVVRTSSRLIAPVAQGPLCKLCRLAVPGRTGGLHWGGEQECGDTSLANDGESAEIYCYGCARSTLNP